MVARVSPSPSRASRRARRRAGAGDAGTVVFNIVGLADKAVAESRERVRAALIASGLALPAKRITVNLAPADLPKEGSHYDLPIALGLMAAMGVLPPTRSRATSCSASWRSTARSPRSPACCPRRSRANAAGARADLPGGCGPEAAWAASSTSSRRAR